MREFKGIVPERKKSTRIAFALLVVLMMVISFLIKKYIYLPLEVLVFLACFFSKEHIVSEEGVDLRYKLFGANTVHNWWGWDEITSIHTDYRKAAPKVQLHIGKDIVVRTFIMEEKDIPGIIKLAKEKNPEIYIED